MDEEPLLGKKSWPTPNWRCYAKHISSQQILLTFLPASFTGRLEFLHILTFPWSTKSEFGYRVYFVDVQMLMASDLETEPLSNLTMQEDDTLTFSNKSQADSPFGSTSGLERSDSSQSPTNKLRRSSSSLQFTARSPVLSPNFEDLTIPPDSLVLEQESWCNKVTEAVAGTSGSGQSSPNQFSIVRSRNAIHLIIVVLCVYVF